MIWCENKGLLHHGHLKQDLGGDKAGKEGKGCVMCIIHRYNMQMMLPRCQPHRYRTLLQSNIYDGAKTKQKKKKNNMKA